MVLFWHEKFRKNENVSRCPTRRDTVSILSMKGKKKMKHIAAKQAATNWEISEQLVRRYCKEGRIENAYQESGVWYIPENAEKPTRKKKEEIPLPKLLLKLCKQRDSGKNKGLYDYLQINTAYSNNRMASNRLTRQQVEMLYKSDKIFTVNEAIKVNDIIEARNQFVCIDYVLSEAMHPLTWHSYRNFTP